MERKKENKIDEANRCVFFSNYLFFTKKNMYKRVAFAKLTLLVCINYDVCDLMTEKPGRSKNEMQIPVLE